MILLSSLCVAIVFLVPAVTIVVEGGKDTITNMYYDLRANIPVVIIDVSRCDQLTCEDVR